MMGGYGRGFEKLKNFPGFLWVSRPAGHETPTLFLLAGTMHIMNAKCVQYTRYFFGMDAGASCA